MTLTVQDIRRMLESGSMRRGYAANRLSHDKRDPTLTQSQRAFLQDVWSAKAPAVTVPQHPDEVARHQRRDGDELTAVELAWLQRLPLDPTQITFDTAVELASLARSISSMKSPASARLVESIWGPVKAIHDERVAAANVERARQGRLPIPESAAAAIADTLVQQFPDEHPEGIAGRARETLADIEGTYQRRHESALTSAEAELETARGVLSEQQETQRETVA